MGARSWKLRGRQLIVSPWTELSRLLHLEVKMKTGSFLQRTSNTAGLVAVLGISLAATAQQSSPPSRPHTLTSNTATAPEIDQLPDSPSATMPTSRSPWELAQVSPQMQSSSSSQSAQQNTPAQRPVGTAAAEAPSVSAVAASQPAGIAMAPAKQHRVRTIILRTGAILGAGAAIGTVIALTQATPSKPPGAH